jgi:hypothetical protein
VNDLSGPELEGAYRRLCASVLAQAAFVAGERGLGAAHSKHDVYFRGQARQARADAMAWIEGGDAVLPFAECCETLDMDEEAVRAGFERYISNPDHTLHKRWRNAASRKPTAIR